MVVKVVAAMLRRLDKRILHDVISVQPTSEPRVHAEGHHPRQPLLETRQQRTPGR